MTYSDLAKDFKQWYIKVQQHNKESDNYLLRDAMRFSYEAGFRNGYERAMKGEMNDTRSEG
jgi:hypothetical protein